ncbi:transporter substrate-binding domain-containing protein [Chitinimonas arctica]|uniref:Transporter substrate-binding domain-containing protein n=1 Tax=Chitinimonas arctica TaxID=2594795 RepID=A0A516SBC8_9NEIS|nr:transporter substrate-binding domain-containing protein [Chitinimonas arctica]QDQ25455.1 transporter substrate-binding domain-containing protein [Chitinimonas arctica]
MFARARMLIPFLLGSVLLLRAEAVEFRVAYEDKDTPDHTGASELIPDDPGISVEMVKLIEKKVPDLRIVFSRKPWLRCLAELESGAADGIFASSFKLERLKNGAYPMKDGKDDRTYRIDTKSYSLYKRKDSAVEWNGRSFSGLQLEIAAMRGYAIVEDLKKMGVAVSVVDKSESALRMLLAGRIDGFAQLTEVGDYTLKKYPEFQTITKVQPPLVTKDYYLQISHPFMAKYPELSWKIWKALAEIRQSESERLTLKYINRYSDTAAEAAVPAPARQPVPAS